MGVSSLDAALIESSSVEEALVSLDAGKQRGIANTGGGCINETSLITTDRGETFFLKQNRNAPQGLFRAEASGLLALASDEGPRVPRTLALGDEKSGAAVPFLLMEAVKISSPGPDTMRQFGCALARLHRSSRSPQCGFAADNHIGATEQKNGWRDSWLDFFREQRLGFQIELAARRGLADRAMVQEVEAVMVRLDRWLREPEEGEASLLHGDLWGGNFIVDSRGEAVLIDPAVYYGHREADLAMTRLFGGFTADFYRGYEAEWPLEPGFDERCGLYNLYHMLNHLNLFGGSYAGSVRLLCRRYS